MNLDLNTIGSICSIASLLISILVLTKINSINKSTVASGQNSKAAGRDLKETKV